MQKEKATTYLQTFSLYEQFIQGECDNINEVNLHALWNLLCLSSALLPQGPLYPCVLYVPCIHLLYVFFFPAFVVATGLFVDYLLPRWVRARSVPPGSTHNKPSNHETSSRDLQLNTHQRQLSRRVAAERRLEWLTVIVCVVESNGCVLLWDWLFKIWRAKGLVVTSKTANSKYIFVLFIILTGEHFPLQCLCETQSVRVQ